MAPVIVVKEVNKRFRLQRTRTLKQTVMSLVKRKPITDTFLALQDVSFRVPEGQSVALMGLNGSGKSTLLKLISGVMAPDHGRVRVRGHVAGLIEVGAGFHPDLTGRENVYLNAAILGMSEAEVNEKFDSIVDFSGVERFIDTEVGNYSSGMFMRLGFAVCIHTDCDIFLIDEVLAVGDRPFKKKCMERIHKLRYDGRTIVFVSHNYNQVQELCDRALVLESGRLAFDGSVEDAGHYLGYDEDEDDPDAGEF
jgi:ABC-2 type transport system ATP-binding protein